MEVSTMEWHFFTGDEYRLGPDPEMRISDHGGRSTLPSRYQLGIIDQTAAYLAHVIQTIRPDAQWSIYRHRHEVLDGETVPRVTSGRAEANLLSRGTRHWLDSRSGA
ncbi:MAG: hypothetical protein QM635_04635 [Microbacteriaceae bacterium]